MRALLAIAILLGAARADAESRCPILLDGDPAVAAEILAELARFAADDSHCVALEVACSARDGALVLELHDALGGTAERAFASPAGAAAFLVSWSRRLVGPSAPPLDDAATPPAPSLAPRVVARTIDAPRRDNELALLWQLTPHGSVGGLQLIAMRSTASRRLGLGARLLTAAAQYRYELGADGPRMWNALGAGTQGFATYVVQRRVVPALLLHADIEAGATLIAQEGYRSVELTGFGVHAGGRIGAALRITDGVDLDLGIGMVALWQLAYRDISPFTNDALYSDIHYGGALRWML